MAFISFIEIVDIFIMSFLIGWLFKDHFHSRFAPRGSADDIIENMNNKKSKSWYQNDLLFATAVAAPGIILHEMAHKFTAMGFGHNAVFHAFYADSTTLTLGIIAIAAKLLNFGFMFLVPGFVSILGQTTAFQSFWIAFAGPLVHLIIWVVCFLLLKFDLNLSRQKRDFFGFMKYLNMLLFVFNMLPIPGIDGFNVYVSLYQMIF